MVMIREFRIPVPISLDNYDIAQLFCVAEMSKEETSGDAGVEILKNEPYDDPVLGKGQYTQKIYHLGTRVPKYVQVLAPASSLILIEDAWNGFPYTKTVLKNPFLGDRFELTITTIHAADKGHQENAHNLSGSRLKNRVVDYINIVTDKVEPDSYDAASDPSLVGCERANISPLKPDWLETLADDAEVVTAYKLVEMKFNVFGLETKVQNYMINFQRNMLLQFNRKIFCYMDRWLGMSKEDVRAFEDQIKRELDQAKLEREELSKQGKSSKKSSKKDKEPATAAAEADDAAAEAAASAFRAEAEASTVPAST
ncbi:hypothetical protein H696_06035 [Fonticula alba]|uniref:Phosphatidylinositol transfer protein N-terminal domain-containing protein n=1 Tax=Fonticula alba TaxID=691883 RepID=A0A058Z085_FONAL|nr:hypothetical protein H696_06035 [Fonticula alba]KCV67516.1 hypothetical protein H696_06035 [Fonticula alba]|eukprot:XP_009498077.1 hypothetical protein H696_06035 [Fonticula alba]